MALGVSQIDLKTWMVYLQERGQTHLVMTLLRLVEAERMVYWWNGRHDLDVLSHRCLLVVQEHKYLNFARPNHLLTCLSRWSE